MAVRKCVVLQFRLMAKYRFGLPIYFLCLAAFLNTVTCEQCPCNNNNTVSCNKRSGKCICRAGFEGPTCDCIEGRHICNYTTSYCAVHGDSPICVCRPGMYGKNLGCFEPLRYIRNTSVVEVYHQGKWMLIGSPYNWTDHTSRVLCGQLGLPITDVSVTSGLLREAGLLQTDYHNREKLTYLSCQGNETEISQCSFHIVPSISNYTKVPIVLCKKDCRPMMMINMTSALCVPCSCNQSNTVTCNQTTGACNCKEGFYGLLCDCIKTTREMCNETFSYCSILKQAETCVCRPGYSGKGLGCFEHLRYIQNTNFVEYYYNNKWMLFEYFYSWEDDFTRVICRQLGLPTFHVSRSFGRNPMSYREMEKYGIITRLWCRGNETEIKQCKMSTYSRIGFREKFLTVKCLDRCPEYRYGPTCKRCKCNEMNSVKCDDVTEDCSCKEGYFGDTCDCVEGVHSCNQTYSFCGSGASNAVCYCKSKYNRLGFPCEDSIQVYVNKQYNRSEGVLRIFKDRTWKTFCVFGFTYESGLAACRGMNLPSRHVSIFWRNRLDVPFNFYSEMSGGPRCKGTERSLFDCEQNRSELGICYTIPYLQCFSACPNWQYGRKCEKQCECNKETSSSCDEDSGKCTCKEGYSGDRCNCKLGVHKCNTNQTFCHTNGNGDSVCLCKRGLSEIEYQTEECFDEYVRLTNLSSAVEGVVEIYRSGIWQGLCLNSIATTEAKVICRQLGMPWEFSQVSKMREAMPKSYFYKYKFVCNGTEKTLLDCDRMRIRPCVEVSARIVCPKAPLIRLISKQTNATATSGLLQVFHKNSWGYFCTKRFSDVEAKVACRELGLPLDRVSTLKEISVTDDDTHFTYIACNGDEQTLSECLDLGGTVCNVYMRTIVKLICSSNGNCTSLTFGKNCNLRCPCNGPTTTSCDRNTGNCTCKSRYTGPSCSCLDKFDKCNSTTSDCYDGTYQPGICICKKGYTSFQHDCKDHVRLKSDGLVEVIEHEFHRVCSNEFWHYENALVVCRQLNRNTDVIYSVSVPADRYYRTLDKYFKCNGTEKTVLDCPFTLLYSSCQYYHKLICGECPEWMYSRDCSKNCSCDRRTSTGCDFKTGDCICQEGYGGADCSCHVSIAAMCDGENTFCDFDKCLCRDGIFNNSLSCSDFNNVIFSCSFNQPSWKDDCHIELTYAAFINYNNEIKHDKSWIPETGSDDMNYIYVNRRPYYFLMEDSFFATLQLSLENTRAGVCLHFDYIIGGYGTITVKFVDEKNIQLSEIVLFETQHNWTTKLFHIKGGHDSSQVRFTLEEMTAIDKILITEGICGCANWTFGPSCDDCACVRLHTEFCNKTNGQCHCKPGYTGDACQCADNGYPCPHLIRIVNGNTTTMGRVEVVTNGVWSTVCDQGWSHNEASVVCNQLGLAQYGIPVMDAEFGKGVGPIYIGNFDCNGNEADLLNCTFSKASCSHDDDAGVKCVNQSASIRLVDGTSDFNGRVEVRLGGTGSWGTVCDDGFSEQDARVACRELGLPVRSVHAKSSAFYGQGSGPILLSNLRCDGTETSIQACSKTVRPSSCSHYEDAGVSCSNDCPEFAFGQQCEQSCVCEQSNSLSCDKDTGECSCASGWFGSRCTCQRLTGCDENSYCDGDKCLCNDGFLTKSSNCSGHDGVVYSCSFETDFVTCSINNYGTMKWRQNSRGTKSDDTGPYAAYEGLYYVYTEATGGSMGDEGVMEIPLARLNLTKAMHTCFQFYFHMRGDDIGDLNVTVEENDGSEIARWSKTGHYNSNWNRGLISIPPNAEMLKIKGVRGNGYQSDIGLDDFTIQQGHCECEAWKYGLICEKSCNCKRSMSRGCDSQTGSCECQPGWSGKTCNCRMSADNCHSAFSYCHGNRCLCKDGHYRNGVTCSGLNDITYFCGFDMPDSIQRCNVRLEPTEWDITEDSSQPIDDDLHLEDNRYLKTVTSFFTPKTFFLFSIQNVSIETESCLQLKYVMVDDKRQTLRIQVVEHNEIIANMLLQGVGLSTARIPLRPSSNVKVYIFAHVYNNRPVLIDDIIITSKPCVACTTWYYGEHCENMAKCNRSNTFSFDDNGICTCKSPWFGESCDCTKSENDQCFRQGEVCRKSTCTCRDGYQRAGHGCRDINECTSMCRRPTQDCKNTNGSYSCACKDGMKGDGTICSESILAVTNGSSPTEGTLVIWKSDTWGSVCRQFDLFTALTACKTMFKDVYGVHLSQRGGYKSPDGISYDSILCDRKKLAFDLTQCDFSIGPCDTERKAMYIKCGGCGGVYTSQFGLVEPPLQLLANSICTFLLSPSNAKMINATFIAFSLSSQNTGRSKRYLESCTENYIEAFDGPNTTSPFLGRFCDSKGRFSITSSGNSLFFIYRTSRTTSKHDFQIIYETENVVEEPRDLGEACDVDIQCVANNASCIKNLCKCHADFYRFDDATCAEKKTWNSTCNENLECTTQYCSPSDFVCVCAKGETFIEDHGFCVEVQENMQMKAQAPAALIVTIILLSIILIALLVVAIVVFARKKGFHLWRRDNDAAFTYSELMSASNPLYGFSANDKASHRGSVISINSGYDGNHRIRLTEFEDIYEGMCDDLNWPEEEFRKILETCKRKPTDIAASSRNKYKNRNKDVLPYDFNRLRESGTTSVDDYINASVIEGLHSHYPYYIVTQYPLITTQIDFWRMIWKQRASSIVSLVSNNEKELYFPTKTGVSKSYGKFKVQVVSSLAVHKCTFRCMKITKGSKSHTVNHFQSSFLSNFTKDECQDLVNLINLVHSNSEDGYDSRPMVIHCLNGTGKSGVFVGMDYLMQLIRNGDTHIDLFNLAHILISNREKLIESEAQYQFLFDCLDFYLEHNKTAPSFKVAEEASGESEEAGLIEMSPQNSTTHFSKTH